MSRYDIDGWVVHPTLRHDLPCFVDNCPRLCDHKVPRTLFCFAHRRALEATGDPHSIPIPVGPGWTPFTRQVIPQVLEGLDRGYDLAVIAADTGRDPVSLERQLYRAGRHDLVHRLRPSYCKRPPRGEELDHDCQHRRSR